MKKQLLRFVGVVGLPSLEVCAWRDTEIERVINLVIHTFRICRYSSPGGIVTQRDTIRRVRLDRKTRWLAQGGCAEQSSARLWKIFSGQTGIQQTYVAPCDAASIASMDMSKTWE